MYANPPIGGNQSNGNMRWGFYADGFFDRRAHNNPYVGPGVNGYDVREGKSVQVISRILGGVIVGVRGRRILISDDAASRIKV